MIAVEEYTATLKGKDGISAAKPDTQRKATKAITDFNEYLSQFDKTIPDESDIEAYRVKSEATDGSKGYQATRTKITYIRGYFALNEERSKEVSMTDETMKAPETLGAVETETAQASEETSQCVDDETSTEITAPNEPESLPEAEPVKGGRKTTKNKGGRKPLDENGETRSEKMTAYFTPSMADNIRLWCDWTGISYGDLTVKLFGAFLKDKGDMLNDFRKSREEAKRMNDAQ